MKKLLILLGCASMLFTACKTEDIKHVNDGASGEGNVTFTVNLPVDNELNMRTALYGENSNSAAGGLTNVNMTAYDLRYQLAIYRVDGTETLVAVAPIKKIVDRYEPVTYTLRLTPNRTYKAVVWADFVTQGTDTDLHYNTSDFKAITYANPAATAVLNDETRDAYFITQEFAVGTTSVNQALVLKRPFAKLRAVTTDWGIHNLEKADNFKVTYYGCKRFKNLNAVTGVSESDDLATTESTFYTGTINKTQKEYALNYDLSENNRTLIVDYLMTDLSNQTPIHLRFEAFDGATAIASHDLKTNIPIQRNWLTTITGNLLTANAVFNVSIDEHFANEWNVAEEWWNPRSVTPVAPAFDAATNTYTIRTRAEFAWLPGHEADLVGKTVVLANDIDMSGVDWTPITDAGTYTFDGKGHTVRNISVNGKFVLADYKPGVNAFTGVWAKFTGTMKNVTFENITINGRADDAVHTNTSGAVDHSNEQAYFAGLVGYAGLNHSVTADFDNVHVKHIYVKASSGKTVQNIGGLLGWLGSGTHTVQNCSVTDAYLVSGNEKGEVGGLIGEILGGRGITIKNCTTNRITIRMGTTAFQDRSGFVGKVKNGSATKFEGCTAPTVVKYINEAGQPITDYTPANQFYGSCENDESAIQIVP